jgi:iron complex transport system permease protein
MGEHFKLIMLDIRLPRTVSAILVGFGLGVCGAAMQGLLRNPLAEPGVLGVSGFAALGAVLALYIFGAAAFSWLVPLSAMGGALFATCVLVVLALRQTSILGLILGGIALSTLAGALISLVMNLSPTPVALSEIVNWLMGSVANRSWFDVVSMVPFFAIGFVCLGVATPALQALSLGEDVAASLGVDLRRTHLLLIVATAMIVGASVALAGTIGFVGLVVPHMLRRFVHHNPSQLVLPSGLAGACLLVLADVALRCLPAGLPIQLGVLTALIGAPVFLYMVLRLERGKL